MTTTQPQVTNLSTVIEGLGALAAVRALDGLVGTIVEDCTGPVVVLSAAILAGVGPVVTVARGDVVEADRSVGCFSIVAR